jgi:hypothetical protein
MSNDVLDFLTKLATEPEVLSEFLHNSSAVMHREGINEKVQRALLSGEPTRVHAAIRGEAEAYEAAYEKSLENARVILNILATDPTVAGWVYSWYAQAIQRFAAGCSSPAAPAGMPQTANE